jgi:hypothetical protein
MLLGWYGLAETVRLSRQATFLVVAITGLLVMSSGVALWLLAGMRAVRNRRLLVQQAGTLLASTIPPPATATAGQATSPDLVATPSMTRYHLRRCLLVEGKPVAALDVSDHQRAGRVPCPVCAP